MVTLLCARTTSQFTAEIQWVRLGSKETSNSVCMYPKFRSTYIELLLSCNIILIISGSIVNN